eukprot:PITA_17967
MAVRVATAMAKVSGAVHGAERMCGLLPLQTNFGRSFREASRANSQIQYRIILKRTAVKAAKSSDNQFGSGGPSRVDAEMIVLRKRIQELRMQETNYLPPQHWMKWEKDWSVTYASDICEFVGWLQNMLINTRPVFAIVALALILLSLLVFVSRLLFLVLRVSTPLIALAMEFVTKLLHV